MDFFEEQLKQRNLFIFFKKQLVNNRNGTRKDMLFCPKREDTFFSAKRFSA